MSTGPDIPDSTDSPDSTEKHEAEAAVRDAYGGLSRLALSLTDDQAWVASGCAGWAVRDPLFG